MVDYTILTLTFSGSYRELLATAQAIVVLDEQTRLAEDHLSSISHDCRPPRQQSSLRAPTTDKVTLAQFRLLQRCCTTAASALRTQHLLQCARLIVVARLLLKSLSELEAMTKSVISMRDKLSNLRRQLLLQLEAKLINPTSDLPDVLESICCYCLVTSGSAEDALAHMRHLRLEKIRRRLTASQQSSSVSEALSYQLLSLQTFKSLIGRPLVEAMNDLQKKPILAEPSIRNLESLDLDRILSLIPNDVRSFTPYFKRVAPSFEEMQSKFETWSREACDAFSGALRERLAVMTQMTDILELRRQLYFLLMPNYFSTVASSHIREQVAEALSEKVREICRLQSVVLEHSKTLLLNKEATSRPAKLLWDSSLALANLDAGGEKVIREVTKRHAGHNSKFLKGLKSLETWILSTETTLSQLDDISKIRWRDIIEEPDEENEDEAESLIKLLSETEPELYKTTLQDSLRAAVLSFETNIAEAAATAINEKSDVSHLTGLLRSIRVSATSLQQSFPTEAKFEMLRDVTPKLQHVIAAEVAERLTRIMQNGTKAGKWATLELPDDMPSPRAFTTLRQLCKIMLDIDGTDVWSPPLVDRVKETAAVRIFTSESKANYVNNEFDEAYLGIALGKRPEQTTATVAKSAAEYWTRTKLLFGILS